MQTQAKLSDNLQGKRTRTYARNPSLLAGKIFDAAGERMLPVHANKQSQAGAVPIRYRYYVSQALQEGRSKDGWRVPAREVEAVVAERLAKALDDPIALLTLAELPFHADQLANLDQRAREMAAVVRQRGHAAVTALVDQVRLEDGRIVITCSSSALCEALGLVLQADAPATIELVAEVRLTRSGKAMRLIDGNGHSAGATSDRSLLKLTLQARDWWAELRKGELNVTQLAAREGVQDAWVTRVVRLAFLSPDVVDAIVKGNQPASLSANKLLIGLELPVRWKDQQQLLLA